MGVQISEVINLRLRGSKLSNDYSVLVHGKIKYENGKYPLKKLTSGLRFKSLLINKHNARKGNGRPLGS